MVVTPGAKIIAWIVVILLNFFFVFFSILRGLQRGEAWQRLYLMACIFRKNPLVSWLIPFSEILVEVIIYETSECAIVHFVIPDLAREEVRTASLTIKKVHSSSPFSRFVLTIPRRFNKFALKIFEILQRVFQFFWMPQDIFSSAPMSLLDFPTCSRVRSFSHTIPTTQLKPLGHRASLQLSPPVTDGGC